MPNYIDIAGPAMTLAIVALAQRLGGFRSQHLGRLLLIVAGLVFAVWLVLVIPQPWGWMSGMGFAMFSTWRARDWLREYRRGSNISSEPNRKTNTAEPDIAFGDPIQRVKGRASESTENQFSWWHIPIKSPREIRGCTATAELLAVRYEMGWIIKEGDTPQRRIDLFPEQWVTLPLVARSEIDGALVANPRTRHGFHIGKGKAVLTDHLHITEHQFEDSTFAQTIPTGEHLIKIVITSDSNP